MAKNVKFITNDPRLWLRQTPAHDGVFNDTRFILDPEATDYDYLVVCDYLLADIDVKCPKERMIFVASEPQNVKTYPDEFLAQFGLVLTTDRNSRHPNIIYTQVGLPWHLGGYPGLTDKQPERMNFKDFENFFPEKTKLISVICSNKIFTPQHRRRLEFVQALKKHFGDRLDIFGRGFHEIDDKLEALADYRFHIALENCDFQDYWTEKIADPVLSLTYPIYWGCRNLQDYLPAGSFTRIDIARAGDAASIIEKVIADDLDIRHRDDMIAARRNILYKHNIFALLDRVIGDLEAKPHGPVMASTIRREEHFLPPPDFMKKLRTVAMRYVNKVPALRKVLWYLSFQIMRVQDKIRA